MRRRRRARRLKRWLKTLALVLAGYLYLAYAPDNYNLARPLDLRDRPTFVTGLKLRLGGVDRCYGALDRAGLELERLPDEARGPGCGFEDVARLDRSFTAWGGGITLKCPMLAGLAMWERHTPAAGRQGALRLRGRARPALRNLRLPQRQQRFRRPA